MGQSGGEDAVDSMGSDGEWLEMQSGCGREGGRLAGMWAEEGHVE